MGLSKSELSQLKKDATAAARQDDVAVLTELILTALRKAETASQLWSVATTGPYHEAALGETAFPTEVLDVVVEQSKTLSKPADRASGLSLAARITAFSPVAIIDRWDAARLDKPELIEALRAHRSWLREELSHDKSAVRAAAALALARCGDTEAVGLLVDELGSGSEAGARVLAAASLGGNIEESARALLNSDDAVARTCAACALALGEDPISADVGAILAEAIRAGDKLPRTWGWRWRIGDMSTTRTMACVLLRRAEVEDPKAIVSALAALDEVDRFAADALGALAIPNAFELGVTLEDLDDVLRMALLALTRIPRGVSVRPVLNRLRLAVMGDIVSLVEGAPPYFAPAMAEVDGNERRWHIARVWRGRAQDELTQEAAITSVVSALSPEQIYEAVVSGRHLSHVGFALRDEQDASRSLDLAGGLLERLQQEDFPLRERVTADLEQGGGGRYLMHLAMGALLVFGRDLPTEFEDTVAMGLALSRAPARAQQLLEVLDDDRRAAVAAKVEAKRV